MAKTMFGNLLGLILALTAGALLIFTPVLAGAEGFRQQFLQIKRKQLGPELGVSQQVVDQLLQIEQRYQAMRQKLFRESKADFAHLRQAISRPSPSEPEVRAILTDIKWKLKESQDLHLRQVQEEQRLLTPVQLARNILYHKKLLREARSIKGKRSRPTPPLTPPTGPREVQVTRKAGNLKDSVETYQENDLAMGENQAQLEKALGVERQTVAQLLAIRQRYRPQRQQLISDAKNQFQKLEQVMGQRHPDNQEVKQVLANIHRKEQEMQSLKQRQDEEEMAILTPVQQARYLMFLIALRQQMAKGPRSPGVPANDGLGTKPTRNIPGGRFPATR